jgi:ribulose-phosphate 3-epimerase
MLMNLNNRLLISTSIIATDLTTLGIKLKEFDPDIVDLLHMDVMDGVYVPNLTIGSDYIKSLRSHTDIPFDVHLMIERPENSIERYIEINPWLITIHYESTRFPARILSTIRSSGINSGLSINPATPVEMIFDLMPYIDIILIMSVDPGFYGQSFMDISLRRIEKLFSFINDEGFKEKVAIQVDGGITRDNILQVVEAGARIIVTGSSAFKGGDINKNIKDLKEIALSVIK